MADKKLAKKLAKMSEEDRAAYLEKQRLLEEENQRKKEEMLSRFLKDKLVKEEKASKVNMLKIQNQWRDIMRKSKHHFCRNIYFVARLNPTSLEELEEQAASLA